MTSQGKGRRGVPQISEKKNESGGRECKGDVRKRRCNYTKKHVKLLVVPHRKLPV